MPVSDNRYHSLSQPGSLLFYQKAPPEYDQRNVSRCRQWSCLLILAAFTSSCVYRFSNLHMKAPSGARSIGIESIYDTGNIVLPHEYLWLELQRQFAINGRLRVQPVHSADLYLRAHITNALIRPELTEKRKITDPDSFLNDAEPPAPWPMNTYQNQSIAHSYAKSESVFFQVAVEIWDQRKKVKIFTKTYSMSGSWTSYDSSLPPEYTFLQSEESFEGTFHGLAENLAWIIVTDVLQIPT